MIPDDDAVLAQFNRLIQEVLRGNMTRNTFRPWEVELLLDIEGCGLRDAARRETLRRYQRAVQRHMEKERCLFRFAALPISSRMYSNLRGDQGKRVSSIGF